MRRECRERFPRGLSDPDIHHGTCVTHVPWSMPGSLTSGFHWSRRRGNRSRHSRRMRNPQFYISGKRHIRNWGRIGRRYYYRQGGIPYQGIHYSDVIMGTTVSQITSVSIVYLTVCSGPDHRKHQSSATLAFKASNAENRSIWWRHNVYYLPCRSLHPLRQCYHLLVTPNSGPRILCC